MLKEVTNWLKTKSKFLTSFVLQKSIDSEKIRRDFLKDVKLSNKNVITGECCLVENVLIKMQHWSVSIVIFVKNVHYQFMWNVSTKWYGTIIIVIIAIMIAWLGGNECW